MVTYVNGSITRRNVFFNANGRRETIPAKKAAISSLNAKSVTGFCMLFRSQRINSITNRAVSNPRNHGRSWLKIKPKYESVPDRNVQKAVPRKVESARSIALTPHGSPCFIGKRVANTINKPVKIMMAAMHAKTTIDPKNHIITYLSFVVSSSRAVPLLSLFEIVHLSRPFCLD